MDKNMEEFNRWFKQAKYDLKAAQDSFKKGYFGWACFQAQQAAEKALKALLIHKTDQFPKIHDVVELSRRVGATSSIIELCAKINPAYTATRYPDVASKFDKKETKEIIDSSKKVLEWTKGELGL